ncbi:MAG: MBL fold metallo-hydrolase [Oscillatoriales cyanobacterium RU_3_3]|nr:MBL fold metallo-hydrolase [Microcoleus sp. SM1_3_4]NJM63602.1 MBL fold metallo-hydrolase [Oscillatoriales cyanobacterium RU_3_3]NJR25788.1 MBL fold metallo-hydrolase [Richelia sp. CSU_2_1]
MKRRQLLRYGKTSLLAALATGLASGWNSYQAQTAGTLSVQWLGHTCFLFAGGGARILVNPFRPIGCTAGYRPPKVQADLILIGSRLLDEGAIDGFSGNPGLLYEPGSYQFNGLRIQGIRTQKDRQGGRRFGMNVAWLWQQAGVKILHLGGLAGPIGIEEQILIGRPDLVLIPVGGGPKAYTPAEAKQTLQILKPRMVIPTHFKTQAADPAACDLVPLDEFLAVMEGTPVRRLNNDTISISPANLPQSGSAIEILSYRFGG